MTLNEWYMRKEYLREDAVGVVNPSGGPTTSATTSANIAYIPGQLGVIKPYLTKMSKKKTKWGVVVEHYPKMKRVKIEEDLQIDVRPDWFEYFKSDFTGGKGFPSEKFSVDLTPFLNESLNDELSIAKEECKRSFVELMNSDLIKNYHSKNTSVVAESKFKDWDIANVEKSVLSDLAIDKQFEQFMKLIEEAYGDNKGAYEALTYKVQNRQTLKDLRLFSNFDNLMGTILKGDFLGIPIVYTTAVVLDFTTYETLEVSNEDVINKFKTANFMHFENNKFYPNDKDGFPRNFTNLLKDLIKGT